MNIFELFISAVFVNNIILIQNLGICPFVGCSKEKGVAFGMGGAVIFVTLMATICTWAAQKWILIPLSLTYLQTLVFILIIASLVQFVEMFLKKAMPPLYASLGIFLPLITTNCAVMGTALVVQREGFSLWEGMLFAVATSLGFLFALLLMAGVRERLETFRVPKAMAGTPISLVMAGIMALSFMAFKGMV